MKNLLLFLVALSVSAQPIQRQVLTTNTYVQNTAGAVLSTNLLDLAWIYDGDAISTTPNTLYLWTAGSSYMANGFGGGTTNITNTTYFITRTNRVHIYGTLTNTSLLQKVLTLDPLWHYTNNVTLTDVTNVAASLSKASSMFYFRAGITNTLTNSCYLLSTTFNSSTTNVAVSWPATNNNYLLSFFTTNYSFSYIDAGQLVVDFDAYLTSGGGNSLVVKPEFYLQTNGVLYYEFSDVQQVTLTTTRAHYRSVIIATTNAPIMPLAQFGIRFKCISQNNNPSMVLVSGSNAISGVLLPTPVVVTSTGGGSATGTITYSITNNIATTNLIVDCGAFNQKHFTNSMSGGLSAGITISNLVKGFPCRFSLNGGITGITNLAWTWPTGQQVIWYSWTPTSITSNKYLGVSVMPIGQNGYGSNTVEVSAKEQP